MSLLGWVVGAMVLDELDSRQDEIDARERAQRERDHALRARERKLDDLEARLRRVEGAVGSRASGGSRPGGLGRYGSWN